MQELASQQNNEEKNSFAAEVNNNPVACAELMSEKGWEEIPRDNFTVVEISEAFQIRNSENIKEEDINGNLVKVKTQSGKTQSAVAKSNSLPPHTLEIPCLFL